MKNRKILSVLFASIPFISTALCVASCSFTGNHFFSAENNEYTLNFDSNNVPASMESSIMTNNFVNTASGYTIRMTYSNCETASGNHAKILTDGYIKNSDPIHGIFSITNLSNNFSLEYSNDGNAWTTYGNLATSAVASLPENTNYFKISGGNSFSGVSFSIKYSCIDSTATTYDPADYYDGYYAGIESWTDGEDLMQQLHDVITNGYTALPYATPNWESNKNADHTLDSYLSMDVVYSSESVPAKNTNQGWQREHAFCASLMTGSLTGNAVNTLGRATDFHNLFAGQQAANGARGNTFYGNCSEPTTDNMVNDGEDGYRMIKNIVFEPGNKDKGRVARAIFYMCTMYNEDVYDSNNGILMKALTVTDDEVAYASGADCAFAHGHLSDLLDWNNTIAVDELEMQHNVSVYKDKFNGKAQGNRNPYVDYPGLVDYVYGSKKDQPGRLEDIKPSAVDLGFSNANKTDHRRYVLKSVKETYSVEDTFSNNDVVIYDIGMDFTTISTSYANFTTTYTDHTFDGTEGKNPTNTITVGEQNISYSFVLQSMTAADYYTDLFSASDFDKTVGAETTPKTITKSGETWTFTPELVHDGASNPKNLPYTNTTAKGGGLSIGSASSYSLHSATFESTNSFTIKDFFIKAYTNAKNGTPYTVKVYVGGVEACSLSISYNEAQYKIYDTEFEPMTGKIKIVITGDTSFALQAFAFNEVEA